jgi:hypothetical protein
MANELCDWRVVARTREVELFEIEQRWTVLVDELEHAPATARDARERIFGNHDGQPSLFHQQFVDVAEQGATASQYDATFRNVGA